MRIHFVSFFQFYTPTVDDIPEMKAFLVKEFYPQEPLCKNSRVGDTGSWLDRKLMEFNHQWSIIGG